MEINVIFFVIAAVLAGVAAFIPKAGPLHLGWLAVLALALGHVF